MNELLEEEELAAIREHQREFEHLRSLEIAEVKRLEAEDIRRAEEKARRMQQEKERLLREAEVSIFAWILILKLIAFNRNTLFSIRR